MSARKPQPPQRKGKRAAGTGSAAERDGQELVVSCTTSPEPTGNVRLEEMSSPLDKTSSKGTPQMAGRNVQTTENYSTTPPFENYKGGITAPDGAQTTISSSDSGKGNKKDVVSARHVASPSTHSFPSRVDRPAPPFLPFLPFSPADRPQASPLGGNAGGSPRRPVSQEEAYTELVRKLNDLFSLAEEQSLDDFKVDGAARRLAVRFDCGNELRRQALCHVFGRERGDAILGSIKVPAGSFAAVSVAVPGVVPVAVPGESGVGYADQAERP